MLNEKNRLTILHDDNSSFLDYSDAALSYVRDTFTLPIVSLEDALYIGFEKPINAVYAELATANTQASTITLNYYNGTTFTPVTGFLDDTVGLTRSGFVTWDRNLEDEAVTTVNSVEQFWYRADFSADLDVGTALLGLNIVFSDDTDLKEEFFNVSRFLAGENSFILYHVGARNEIIQRIRNDGRFKINYSDAKWKDITVWDILDITQIRSASKYLTLSKIFGSKSDSPDDIYAVRENKYMSMYNKAYDLFFLNLDTDDDGEEDQHEQLASFTSKVIRA